MLRPTCPLPADTPRRATPRCAAPHRATPLVWHAAPRHPAPRCAAPSHATRARFAGRRSGRFWLLLLLVLLRFTSAAVCARTVRVACGSLGVFYGRPKGVVFRVLVRADGVAYRQAERVFDQAYGSMAPGGWLCPLLFRPRGSVC